MTDWRTIIRLALFGLISLLIPGFFISLQITRGADWTHVIDSVDAFTPSGVRVGPYPGLDGPFPAGSTITAVDGEDMVDWAEAVFLTRVDRPSWQTGDTHTYSFRLPDGRPAHVEITLGELPIRSILGSRWGVLAFALISQVIGVFILWRRPHEPAAQALFVWALSGSHTYAWSFPLHIGDLLGALGFWLSYSATVLMWVLYFAASVHIALVFPRPVAKLRQGPGAALTIYLAAMGIFLAAIGWGRFRAENTLQWFRWWALAGDLVAALGLGATLAIIVLRYRLHLSGEERAKVRWAVYGASISGSLGLSLWILAPRIFGIQVMSANTLGLLMVIFPISLAIAIWRHRLFDIDLIIRRTLVYAVLTALLVAIYSLSVVGLQTLFRSRLSDASPLIVVLSTLAATALFSPIHSRVQNFIDRRFYRQKYDASRALSRFAESAQAQLNLFQLVGELREVIVDTIQPNQVMVWLREEHDADE